MNIPTWFAYFLFTGCAGFWLIAYILIIRRGYRDRTCGMPIVALAANVSWEFIFSFIYPSPHPLILWQSILWFGLDIVIATQCWLYGKEEHSEPRIRRYFRPGILAIGIAAFAVLMAIIREFDDVAGWYTGFGQCVLMSALFIAMLLRRNSLAGQSLYIAICKFLGSLCAFGVAVFLFRDLHVPPTSVIPTTSATITPYFLAVYAIIFVLDIIYIALIIDTGRRQRIDLWRRL